MDGARHPSWHVTRPGILWLLCFFLEECGTFRKLCYDHFVFSLLGSRESLVFVLFCFEFFGFLMQVLMQ